MTYIKIADGLQESYSLKKLRLDNPNVSFPATIPDTVLASYGVYKVEQPPAELPVFDEETQVCEKSKEAVSVDGKWSYVWVVRDLTETEIEQRVANLSVRVRAKRDALLAECDWTQVADAPVDKAAWATYRQALRDITVQTGFPDNIIWPVMPDQHPLG